MWSRRERRRRSEPPEGKIKGTLRVALTRLSAHRFSWRDAGGSASTGRAKSLFCRNLGPSGWLSRRRVPCHRRRHHDEALT